MRLDEFYFQTNLKPVNLKIRKKISLYAAPFSRYCDAALTPPSATMVIQGCVNGEHHTAPVYHSSPHHHVWSPSTGIAFFVKSSTHERTTGEPNSS